MIFRQSLAIFVSSGINGWPQVQVSLKFLAMKMKAGLETSHILKSGGISGNMNIVLFVNFKWLQLQRPFCHPYDYFNGMVDRPYELRSNVGDGRLSVPSS